MIQMIRQRKMKMTTMTVIVMKKATRMIIRTMMQMMLT